jgi:hypothetical protein
MTSQVATQPGRQPVNDLSVPREDPLRAPGPADARLPQLGSGAAGLVTRAAEGRWESSALFDTECVLYGQ